MTVSGYQSEGMDARMINNIISEINELSYLILTHHRHLLHGMQNVSERDVRVLPVNLICALDAQIEGWWTVGCVGDANIVVVANLDCLCVA